MRDPVLARGGNCLKKVLATTLGLLLAGATATAAPVTDFEKGAVTVEFGSTFNSNFNGSGAVSGSAGGKSGFKYAITSGLGDNWAVQYRGGKFKSEDFSGTADFLPDPVSTYGKSDHQEFNVVHRLNPNLSLVVGLVQNTFSYGLPSIKEATKSGVHIGFEATKKINDKSSIFASLVGGKDVSFWETGISYKLAKDTALNVSYAERNFKNVDLEVPPVPKKSENYKLKGITCVVSTKL